MRFTARVKSVHDGSLHRCGGLEDRSLNRRDDDPMTAVSAVVDSVVVSSAVVRRAHDAGASVVLYGLSNPFRATGYAGDPAGGTHRPRAAMRAKTALRRPALATAEIAWLGLALCNIAVHGRQSADTGKIAA